MNKRQLVKRLFQKTYISKQQIEKIITEMVSVIQEEMQEPNGAVTLSGFISITKQRSAKDGFLRPVVKISPAFIDKINPKKKPDEEYSPSGSDLKLG